VTLKPVHLVGVSANVILVTLQGPRGEDAHQFEMFAIPQQYKIRGHEAQNFWPSC